MNKQSPILIDGSQGEGGGQILRSSLSLSAITGKPFVIENIRSGRQKPGLMRQHLTCVQAAAELCQANISEVGIGSEAFTFEPGEIQASCATFAIGTAGSISLLLQTILPILLHADNSSEVVLTGGTHAIQAPSIEYIEEIYLPVMMRAGAHVELDLVNYGFFPAGGGEVILSVQPSQLHPLTIRERNDALCISAEVINTPEIPDGVGDKEIAAVEEKLRLHHSQETRIAACHCPGNVLIVRASGEPGGSPGTLVSACGEKNKRSQQVAKEAVRRMGRYINSPASVDEFLADQLLLPMALAGGGEYSATCLTPHFHSNVQVIEQFLPVTIHHEKFDRFGWRVEISTR